MAIRALFIDELDQVTAGHHDPAPSTSQHLTTLALGEEGNPPDPTYTTLAYGEDGNPPIPPEIVPVGKS